MVKVLEDCTTEEQPSAVHFQWKKKDLMQNIFIKKCFLFKYGSVCRAKVSQLGGKLFSDDEEVQTEVRNWLRQQSRKSFLCSGFRRSGRAMRQVYQCWWRLCRQINVSFIFEYHIFFTFYIHFLPIYWLSLVLSQQDQKNTIEPSIRQWVPHPGVRPTVSRLQVKVHNLYRHFVHCRL
jgi:hypothetical protein